MGARERSKFPWPRGDESPPPSRAEAVPHFGFGFAGGKRSLFPACAHRFTHVRFAVAQRTRSSAVSITKEMNVIADILLIAAVSLMQALPVAVVAGITACAINLLMED